MSEYLKNKYNKDFEVGRPKLSGGGLDVLGTWEADAYPTDDKSMMFRIIKAENRDNFSDQYTAKIWSQRETARLNSSAKRFKLKVEGYCFGRNLPCRTTI